MRAIGFFSERIDRSKDRESAILRAQELYHANSASLRISLKSHSPLEKRMFTTNLYAIPSRGKASSASPPIGARKSSSSSRAIPSNRDRFGRWTTKSGAQHRKSISAETRDGTRAREKKTSQCTRSHVAKRSR